MLPMLCQTRVLFQFKKMPATLDPKATSAELRSATRIGVRTPVVVYYFDAQAQLVRCRAWTDDLSSGGARITSEQPLLGEQFFVRVMLPDLKDQVISCQVVREIPNPGNIGNRFDIRRSYYGIQFLGLATQQVVKQTELLDQASLGHKSNSKDR
jgi:PilZ domain